MDIHNLTPEEKRLEREEHYRLDFPKAYGISLGEWKCNRVCRMCPMYTSPPKTERYITHEIFQRACDQVGKRKANLEISAYGETFQHPAADEFMFMARRSCPNARIVVATNGTLLDEERCRKIIDSGIDHLSFSLDAGSRESYQWLTKATDYDDVSRNLERLVNLRNQLGADHLWITTHIIGIKELSHEFTAFVNRWHGIADVATVRTYGNWAGMVDDNGISPAEHQNIPADRYPCAWLWYATKIEPNGDVSKCFIHVTGDKNPLGNIMKSSFEDIWHGEKIRKVRELHQSGLYNEVEHCQNCIVWSLFPNFWEMIGDRWQAPANNFERISFLKEDQLKLALSSGIPQANQQPAELSLVHMTTVRAECREPFTTVDSSYPHQQTPLVVIQYKNAISWEDKCKLGLRGNLSFESGEASSHLELFNGANDLLIVRSSGKEFPHVMLNFFINEAYSMKSYCFADLTYCGHPEMTLEFVPAVLASEIQHYQKLFLSNGNIDMQYLPKVSIVEFDDNLLANFVRLNVIDFAYPKGINLEPSALCNLKCVMCNYQTKYAPSNVRKPHLMPLELFKKISNEISTWPVRPGIEFSFRGEGLINHYIVDGIKCFSQLGCDTVLFTNGMLLNEDILFKLKSAALSCLYISLDALEETHYEAIRPGASYQKVLHHITQAITILKSGPPPHPKIGIRMVRMDENSHYWDQIFHVFEHMVDYVSLQNQVVFENNEYVCKNMFKIRNTPRQFCILPWQNVMIASNGDVYSCGVTNTENVDEVLGNLNNDTLLSIWNSPRMLELRNQMFSLKVSHPYQCNRCTRAPCSASLVYQTCRGNILDRTLDSVRYTTNLASINAKF